MHQYTPRYKNTRQTEYAVETVSVMREAMEGEDGISLSAEELIAHINRTLHWVKRVSYAKFEEYREAVRTMGQEEVEEQELFDPTYGWLYDIYMEKRFDHKKELYSELRNAPGNSWIKPRWLMERIFPDFDLKQRNMQLKKKPVPQPEKQLEKKTTPQVPSTTKAINEKCSTPTTPFKNVDDSQAVAMGGNNDQPPIEIQNEIARVADIGNAILNIGEINSTAEYPIDPFAETNVPPPRQIKRGLRWMEPDGITFTSEEFKATLFSGKSSPLPPEPS